MAVLLIATGWYWAFRPNELSDYKPMQRGGMTLMEVGFAEYATQLIGPQDNLFHDSTINLRDVHPEVVTNSAGARVRVLICSRPQLSEGMDSSLRGRCPHSRPWSAGTLNLDQRHNELILAITPEHAGEIDIAGIDVTYTDGLRRGHQHTGNEIHARVSG